MSWVRIMAPLSGAPSERDLLSAAAALARPFKAEVAATFAPADAADLMPWMGEGFMGGVQVAAIDSLKEASEIGERNARASASTCGGDKVAYRTLQAPVAAALAMEARLSDVVVFGAEAARGRGPLVDSFQQVLMEERRPVYVARGPAPDPEAAVAVAWDGGREATRAARVALPWLQKAGRVVILAATGATPRAFDPGRLGDLFAERGVKAEVRKLPETGEAGPLLLAAVRDCGAPMLVAGAFGHPRFQQFIFGGTTRCLLQAADGPSLFLAH
jgi:nucleotide-binding universal stress UspA family protein